MATGFLRKWIGSEHCPHQTAPKNIDPAQRAAIRKEAGGKGDIQVPASKPWNLNR